MAVGARVQLELLGLGKVGDMTDINYDTLIEDIRSEIQELKEDLGVAQNDYQVVYREWRKEYWQRIRAERNLAHALLAVNGVVDGDPECHHENVEVRDGRVYCSNLECNGRVSGPFLHYWEKVGDREWVLVVDDEGIRPYSQFRVWLIRGGRYLVMAHQPGRVKRGENPSYVKLWSEPFVALEDAMWIAERLQNALVKKRSSDDTDG